MAQAALLNPRGASIRRTLAAALLPFATGDKATGSNTDAVVTYDADTARPTIVRTVIVGYSATPTAGAVQIEDGSGNVVWKMYIGTAGPHTFVIDPPREGTKNTAMIVTLAAGGSAINGSLVVNAYREQ